MTADTPAVASAHAPAPILMTPRTAPWPRGDAADPPADAFLADLAVHPAQLSPTIPHVSNVEYVRWLDRAAELHSDAAGLTRPVMLEAGVMWFVARHEIDYRAEVWGDDRLVVATWVHRYARVKAYRETRVVRPADDTVVMEASTLWVLVDLDKRKPVRIPDDWRDRLPAWSPDDDS